MSYTKKRYLKKKKINTLVDNRFFKKKIYKYKYKSFFKNKNFLIFVVNKYNYYTINWKKNYEFYHSLSFLIYQTNLKSLKKKFSNVKYYKLLETIRNNNYKMKIKNEKNFNKIKKNRLISIINYIKLYNLFFYSIFLDIFYLNKFLKKKNRLIYFLILSFKKNKLFFNLQNFNKINYLSISTGFFIKFFEKRKSIKKNKTIKLLMSKYIRKILIVSKIKNIILIIKKIPVFINEIINFLNTPIAHKFINPIDGKDIEENEINYIQFKFLYFLFKENINFSKNKKPQKGRIKRKILRKVTFENKIID